MGASMLALAMATLAFGQGNSCVLTQGSSDDDLIVDQPVTSNHSTVDQDVTPTGVYDIANEASVTQAGTVGTSYID